MKKMILPINKIGDKILEVPCKKVIFEKLVIPRGDYLLKTRCANTLQSFINQMIETAKHYNGVGLAANQVGESLRVFIFKDCRDFKVAINPFIYQCSINSPSGIEGCLSVPKIEADVRRSEWINVRYFDERGNKVDRTLSGLTARIFQHEYDHLNGVLFLDKALKIYYIK